jgi:hypothetical protein
VAGYIGAFNYMLRCHLDCHLDATLGIEPIHPPTDRRAFLLAPLSTAVDDKLPRPTAFGRPFKMITGAIAGAGFVQGKNLKRLHRLGTRQANLHRPPCNYRRPAQQPLFHDIYDML